MTRSLKIKVKPEISVHVGDFTWKVFTYWAQFVAVGMALFIMFLVWFYKALGNLLKKGGKNLWKKLQGGGDVAAGEGEGAAAGGEGAAATAAAAGKGGGAAAQRNLLKKGAINLWKKLRGSAAGEGEGAAVGGEGVVAAAAGQGGGVAAQRNLLKKGAINLWKKLRGSAAEAPAPEEIQIDEVRNMVVNKA